MAASGGAHASANALSVAALEAFVRGDFGAARRCLADLAGPSGGAGDPRVQYNAAVLAFYDAGTGGIGGAAADAADAVGAGSSSSTKRLDGKAEGGEGAGTGGESADENSAARTVAGGAGPRDGRRPPPSCDPAPLLRATIDMLPEELRPPAAAGASASEDVDAMLRSLAVPAAAAAMRARAGFVPVFNTAVVAYHRGRVSAARTLSDFLYAHVEAMEDWLALRTCCLAIDVNLRTGHVAEVARIIAFVEQQLVPALPSNASSLSSSGASTSNATEAAAAAADPSASLAPSSTVAAGADMQPPPAQFTSVAPPWQGHALSMISLPKSLTELTFCMHIYAARLNAATADLKMLRKEAKNAVVLSEDEGNCPTAAALLVKAKLEFNSTKGLRVMESIQNQSSPRVLASAQPLLFNNIGVIHHRMGCHALAAVYLERARDAFDTLFAGPHDDKAGALDGGNDRALLRPQAPSIMAHAHKTHVSYNLGLQHLQLGNYRTALANFGFCAYHDEVLASTSAMLWLRIAECCVAEANSNVQQGPFSHVRGQRQGRRFVLTSPVDGDISLMQYGAVAARAALYILDRSDDNSRKGPGHGAPNVGSLQAVQRMDQKRCSALALIAYTSLHFDPSAAIVACDELVSCSRPGDSVHAVLGRLYGAEALCKLGRPHDAADRLKPLLAMTASSMAEGREAAFVNAGLVHVLRGDIAAAARAAKAALKVTEHHPPDRSPRKNAIMVAAYVSLRDRNMEGARQALRLCS